MIPSPLHLVAGKRTFTSFVSKVKAKVQEYDQQRYARIFSLFACYLLRSHEQRGEVGEGSITFTHSLICRHLTGTPQTPHQLALALVPPAATLLNPRRPHWIDTRSKHITHHESLQNRSQEQLITIPRVGIFRSPLCSPFFPLCYRTSVEALPISIPCSFYRSTVAVFVSRWRFVG